MPKLQKENQGDVLSVLTGGKIQGKGDHLLLNADTDSKQVRINSRDFTQASGDSIGFQSKPAQAATTTGNVYGAQLSPRVSNTFGLQNMVGALVEPIIKGTGTVTGTITGDVRCLELIVSDEGVAGKVVNNDVVGALVMPRIQTNPTGDVCAIKCLNPKTGEGGNANNEDFTCFAKFEVATGLAAKHSDTGASLPTNAGYVRIKIGDTYYKLAAYNE